MKVYTTHTRRCSGIYPSKLLLQLDKLQTSVRRVYMIGNPLVAKDSLPLKILPALRSYFPQVNFVEIDPTEEFIPEENSIIIDTVVGIDKVTWFNSLENFSAPKTVSPHDYDLGFHLRLLRKLGKLDKIMILGIPSDKMNPQLVKKVAKELSLAINSMNQFSEKELQTAIRAAKAAGRAILQADTVRAEKHGMEFKAEVDKIADATIKKTLTQAFPEIPFLTEESGFPKKSVDKLWVIDPIDGTTNFLNGLRAYATLIALVEHGQLVMGVVFLPASNELFWAIKGEGTYLNKRRVHVSKQTESIQKAVVILDPGYHPQIVEVISQTYKKLRLKVGNIGIQNGNGYTLALIAKGELPALIHFYSKIWECAGLLLVQEAGGRVTDFQGRPLKLDFTKSAGFEFVASNGLIHKELLGWLNK